MKILKVLFFIFLSNAVLLAQTSKDSSSNSIQDQFEKVYKESGRYQQYKVIKKTAFTTLQKNTLDSIQRFKKTITTKQKLIKEQNAEVAKYQEEIRLLNNNLEVSSQKENQIYFLGIGLTKANYNLILWSIILVLIALLVYFMYRFKNSNSVTKQTKINLEDMEQEFELHKKKSLEKEQQLRRKLQDEINKQRGVS